MENKACTCGLSSTVQELVRVNHQWQKDYKKVASALDECKNKLLNVEKEKIILESKGKIESPPFKPIPPSPVNTRNDSASIEDIEALKQQVMTYKEDFMMTNRELQRTRSELKETKAELERQKDNTKKILSENHDLTENFYRIEREKQHILNELQRLTNMSSFQFQDQTQFKGYVERD